MDPRRIPPPKQLTRSAMGMALGGNPNHVPTNTSMSIHSFDVYNFLRLPPPSSPPSHHPPPPPPPPPPLPRSQPSSLGFRGSSSSAAAAPLSKRKRGRPRKVPLSLEGGVSHSLGGVMIEVKKGEDIESKMMTLTRDGSRSFCIVSATGSVSSVVLRHSTSTSINSIISYEGIFRIITLSGSFLNRESSGTDVNRTWRLSVCLAGPDGQVFGGAVAGRLIAASRVEITVGSFIEEARPRQVEPERGRPRTDTTEEKKESSEDSTGGSKSSADQPSRGPPSVW
ncbi:PREDICTED: AT-hook motif nuclear-localized protein 13-like [Tarenaya hassleriana]|uniref:AT-hook motif nuclear-localized protein 13-like n=1 Tax=Tarenaya hassleriana TaxID=28532 RepID=UPI00053C7F87|nr:PREDICTED: AT-hook motif nuclear-localized protein 13-like [Tarenaya hassleriana]